MARYSTVNQCWGCGRDFLSSSILKTDNLCRDCIDNGVVQHIQWLENRKGDEIMPRTIQPKVGDILLHKKGGYYRVKMYCRHSENQETLIVYEALVGGSTWARPANMFTEDRFTIAIKAEDF